MATITVGNPKQIFSRSEFGRKKNLSAGSSGMLFIPSVLKAIFSARDPNKNYLKFCKYVDKNSKLFPEISADTDDLAYIYYRVHDINKIIEDSGVLSITFFLGYCKNDRGNCPDVIFSVQYKNKELFFASKNGSGSTTSEPKQTALDNIRTPEECKSIAISHSIRQDIFQEYLNGFWQDIAVPPPSVITWDNFTQLVMSNGNNNYLVLTWQDDDKNSNDLNVSFTTLSDEDAAEKISSPPSYTIYLPLLKTKGSDVLEKESITEFMTEDVNTNYSIDLFNGIHYLMTDDVVTDPELAEYRLYKGQTEEQELTILVEAVYLDGSRQFFDLSNERP